MKNILRYLKRSAYQVSPVPPASLPVDEDIAEGHAAPGVVPFDRVDGVVTKIGGTRYTIESDDNYLEHIRGVFEPDMVKLFDSLIQPSDIVLDIGANIGCTSILFGNRAKSVMSFEPSPTTFNFLERNIARAGLQNVAAHNVGLGKTAGTFNLTFSANNRSGGFVSNKVEASAGHKVEAIEIAQGDMFLKALDVGDVDFIKIDVEGFEQDVIEGLRQTISASNPIVVLELNHWCLNVFQRISVPDFLDFLRGVFPYLYAVDGGDVRDLHNTDDAYHVMYHHVVNGFKYPNLVGAYRPAQLEKFHATYGRLAEVLPS